MGNTQSGIAKTEPKGQALIERLNDRSGMGGSKKADTVTLDGMHMFLNDRHERHSGWRPTGKQERIDRYREILDLSETIGMSESPRTALLKEAYKSLNKQSDLQHEGIPDPGVPKSQLRPSSRNDAPESRNPDHPSWLVKDATALTQNPHSYVSLSETPLERLLAMETRKLSEIVQADQTFIKATEGFWNLPGESREMTASHARTNYNAQLSYDLGLTGPTNATPTEAFVNGRNALLNAISQGFDVYAQHAHGHQKSGSSIDNSALKAFGQVALSVNLAQSGNTLTGRGADTMTEQTLAFSPDQHSQQGPSRHK